MSWLNYEIKLNYIKKEKILKKIMKNVLLNMKDVKYNSHSMLSYSLRYNLDKSLLTNQLINNIIRRFFYR